MVANRLLSPIKANHKTIQKAAVSESWKYLSGALLSVYRNNNTEHNEIIVWFYHGELNTTDTLHTTASTGAERACTS